MSTNVPHHPNATINVEAQPTGQKAWGVATVNGKIYQVEYMKTIGSRDVEQQTIQHIVEKVAEKASPLLKRENGCILKFNQREAEIVNSPGKEKIEIWKRSRTTSPVGRFLDFDVEESKSGKTSVSPSPSPTSSPSPTPPPIVDNDHITKDPSKSLYYPTIKWDRNSCYISSVVQAILLDEYGATTKLDAMITALRDQDLSGDPNQQAAKDALIRLMTGWKENLMNHRKIMNINDLYPILTMLKPTEFPANEFGWQQDPRAVYDTIVGFVYPVDRPSPYTVNPRRETNPSLNLSWYPPDREVDANNPLDFGAGYSGFTGERPQRLAIYINRMRDANAVARGNFLRERSAADQTDQAIRGAQAAAAQAYPPTPIKIRNPIINIPTEIEGGPLDTVICHLGDQKGGHYFTLKKRGDDWYRLDDRVDNTTPKLPNGEFQRLLERHSHMLFYGPPPPPPANNGQPAQPPPPP